MVLKNRRSIIFWLQIFAFSNIFIITISENIILPSEEEIKSNCWNKTTCGDCIKTAHCFWCSKPVYTDGNNISLPRCGSDIESDYNSQCEESFVFRHKSSLEIITAKKIEKANGKLAATSITPQRMKIKLRVGEPVKFPVTIGEMEDYPLDLYFLMDLTKTMEDDKEVLANEGRELAEKLKGLTSKFRIGFGSFIDKVTMPFVQTNPKYLEYLERKCPQCVPPYGFKNHIVLSDDVDKFSEEVEKAKISASNDLPEGGLDALMQVMVCRDEIGWKEQARKLVVLATDDSFHIAGDGKLGGIVRPNDGLCHLNADGEYTHSTALDYPSIAQINSKAAEMSITVIFSVTESQSDIYKDLSARVEGSRTITITANSSNIVNTVEDEYKQISQVVEITSNFTNEFLKVQYFSKCLQSDNIEQGTSKCSGLRVGDAVTFNVHLELIKCPTNQNEWNQIFRIYRLTVSDSLLLELEMLCGCPCEEPGKEVVNSPICGGKGSLKCGICECNANHFGRNCECDYLHKNGSRIDKDKSCKRADSDEICSGRGSCVCGQCQCSPREDRSEIYSGSYCECDNFSCERIGGNLCSGHGTCTCGKCECDHGWSGTGCECSNDVSGCRELAEDEICGGKNQGECVCGKCLCKSPYSGDYCQKCKQESCPTKCGDLKDCVQCRLFGTGAYNPGDCDLNCWRLKGLSKSDIVDVIEESDDPDTDEVKCREKDSIDNCTFYFLYTHDVRKDQYVIQAQREKECPPELPLFWIVFGIISLIVLVGILTIIIWQLYEYIQTKREYSTFKNDAKNVQWAGGQNVLYKDPKTTFKNPIYGGMQDQDGFATTERADNSQSRRRDLKYQESSLDE